ncbi:processed acidic surface protein [Thermolongibacillus altinsuensis]|uniref:Processed acidic surface protein n=1 Tax=Thermolongibacillus altinsuensis TaxID=575256 RepID=A0A4R1QGZ7_9BACL|nr:processed acidic surface protein [Thermolongibacillus altinsuensis]TCL52809.1 processed acidic surface protein [Thermolongibacillus altinsuensis]
MRVLLLAALVYMLGTNPVQAEISDERLRHYLTEIGWTMEDLQRHLAKWGKQVSDFSSLEALQKQLGTPITPERLESVFQRYKMDREEVEALLGQFGETVQDYTFIEDLDFALSFYLDRYETMQAMSDLLSTVGMTETEIRKLFDRAASFQQTDIMEQLERIDARLESFLLRNDVTALTEEDKKQLWSLWNDFLTIYDVNARFYLVNDQGSTPISYEQLKALSTLGGQDLAIELYDQKQELVADLYVPNEVMTSSIVFDASEQLAHVGKMALDMEKGMLYARMPNTASSYGMGALIGLLFVMLGIVLYRMRMARGM